MKFICVVFFLACLCLQNQRVFAFWTGLRPGSKAQHAQITSLVHWPENDRLFAAYHDKMSAWSEDPDRRKDPVMGHGKKPFTELDEEERARLSFRRAVEHYQKYLKNPGNQKELEVAAKCLAHAYHYFEDLGDFTEKKSDLFRSQSSGLLDGLVLSKKHNPTGWKNFVDKKKADVAPDINAIIAKLKAIKGQPADVLYVNANIASIVACLEQANVCFLNQVKASPKQK